MNANELADKLNQFGEGAVFASIKLTDVATMLRKQQFEIEALKKQIPDWENINKPNPFVGMSEDPNYKRLPPNSGFGGVALRKAQENED